MIETRKHQLASTLFSKRNINDVGLSAQLSFLISCCYDKETSLVLVIHEVSDLYLYIHQQDEHFSFNSMRVHQNKKSNTNYHLQIKMYTVY